MKKLLLIFFILALVKGHSQKIDSEYVKMLEQLYEETIPFISTKELQQSMNLEDIYILDTRSPAEYNVSHIEGSRLVNYDTFNVKKIEDIPKDAKIIVYCSVGWRSEKVGENLQRKGYQDVYNLYGGIFQWYNDGRPVVNNEGKSTDNIHTYNADWGQWVNKRKGQQ